MAKRVKGRRDGLWVENGQTRPWGDTWNRQGGRKAASKRGGVARKGGKGGGGKKGG